MRLGLKDYVLLTNSRQIGSSRLCSLRVAGFSFDRLRGLRSLSFGVTDLALAAALSDQ